MLYIRSWKPVKEITEVTKVSFFYFFFILIKLYLIFRFLLSFFLFLGGNFEIVFVAIVFSLEPHEFNTRILPFKFLAVTTHDLYSNIAFLSISIFKNTRILFFYCPHPSITISQIFILAF